MPVTITLVLDLNGPFLNVVTDRRVILFSAFLKIGLSVPSSNPVMIWRSLSSVKKGETSSSRPICPLSTHCKAAMEVKSLVQDAIMNVASRFIFSVGDFIPKAFWYWNLPFTL